MLFSCKISHSVLTFLDRHGEDLGSLYENSEWPAELLRDPSYWIEAEKMESLLEFLTARFGHAVPDSALSSEVAHRAFELRSWGALDSVLRLVQSPKDLFSQPERLLSYFISPAPPVGNLRREADAVHFDVPLDSSEYPLVVQYMRAALEALPTYVGRPAATAQWQGSEISIRWTDSQESLFGEGAAEEDRTLNPDLVRNVLQNLEDSQRRLEEAKTHLARKNEELESLRSQLRQAQNRASKQPPGGARQESLRFDDQPADAGAELAPLFGSPQAAVDAGETAAPPTSPPTLTPEPGLSGAPVASPSFAQALGGALDQSFRLADYMARAQQLITILVGQGRGNAQVREAMRRMDWSAVQENAVPAARAVSASLQAMQDELARSGSSGSDIDSDAEARLHAAPSRPSLSRDEGAFHA